MNPEELALEQLIQEGHRLPKRNKTDPLKHYFQREYLYEIGMDEAGRGPLFGRLYVAAVVLPRENFHFEWMKDSKRFSSTKKIQSVATYIRENAIAWSVQYAEPSLIDEINIRQSVFHCMHKCIDDIEQQLSTTPKNTILLIDGCDFDPYYTKRENNYHYHTIEGGDNWYCSIAAASILAKVARDQYIETLCEEHPELYEYSLHSHKGYGTKKHLDAIREKGITQWHRKTFGICRKYIDV